MMSIYRILLLVLGLSSLVLGQDAGKAKLPERASKILDRLSKFEESQNLDLEKRILNKKQTLKRTLERLVRRTDAEWLRKLVGKQIDELNSEVSASERVINGSDTSGSGGEAVVVGGETKDIVDFNVVYHYDHPMEEFGLQKGELTFFSNGKVTMIHKRPNGDVSYSKEYKWVVKDGKLAFMDTFHGEVIISQKTPNKRDALKARWSGLDKNFTIKSK